MKLSPAFKKLSQSITPSEMQYMLDTMSLYKIYTTLGISDKLLMKYIVEHNLKYKKAFKTINDLLDNDKKEIVNEWLTTNTTKRALIKKFCISPNTLSKILKNVNKEQSSIDKNWLEYHKLVLKLTNVTIRHFKLESKQGFDLDHKISIKSGYLQKIPAGLIASLENLEFIPSSVNRANGIEDSISKEKLYQLCNI
jgi:hypothetical protein